MKRKFSKNSNYSLAHVLYQKLGKEWYAFTEVNGDCFMTKVSEKVASTKDSKAPEGQQRRRRAA